MWHLISVFLPADTTRTLPPLAAVSKYAVAGANIIVDNDDDAAAVAVDDGNDNDDDDKIPEDSAGRFKLGTWICTDSGRTGINRKRM